MKKVLIFGASSGGEIVLADRKNTCKIIGFIDNDAKKWGKPFHDLPVLGDPSKITDLEYDEIIIASIPAHFSMMQQLLECGVDPRKISSYFIDRVKARINFLKDYAEVYKIGTDDAVAEGGVYQGDFAKEINSLFPEHTLYLFDTFTGFDERDVALEASNAFSESVVGNLSNTAEEIVMNKMKYPENVVIRKGYFPDTTADMPEEQFFFVNLDFDLYKPTLEGLRYFFDRLTSNGLVLVHDYFGGKYQGIKQAIDDYEKLNHCTLLRMPIGDHCSIALKKLTS